MSLRKAALGLGGFSLECWLMPDGEYLTGELPASLQGHRYDPTLRTYILYQYNHCHVTRPLLLEQLTEWGVDISAGQIDSLLSANEAILITPPNDGRNDGY